MGLIVKQVLFFLKRRPCLGGLIILIVFAVAATVGALFFAPDKIRELAKKIEKVAIFVAQVLPSNLPPATEIKSAYWLSQQNWSTSERYWFHHTTQGTATFPVPYVWFLALQRPELSFSTKYMRDEEFLRRLGFIPSPDAETLKRGAAKYGYGPAGAGEVTQRDRAPGDPAKTDYPENSYALPVGFAKMKGGTDPASNEPYLDQIGFACAACHTGHIEYNNVSIRFDGGPAMVNLGELERAIGLAIGYTLRIPFRFGRFAAEVERISEGPVDKAELKKQLKYTLAQIVNQKRAEDAILERENVKHVDEGFGRLDALNRIGNQVFFANMLPAAPTKTVPKVMPKVMPDHRLAANFARHDAPVSFPPIWGTPWFLWAQYDASVLNELVRNAGEALGVSAKINMTMHGSDKQPLFRSSLELQNIDRFEQMLRGPSPFEDRKFKGLVAPKWSEAAEKFPNDIAWKIDDNFVKEGREVYRDHCFECHRGPVTDPTFDKTWPDHSFWLEAGPDKRANWVTIADRRYFNVVQKPVEDIGTDRQQSRVLTERRVNLPLSLGLRPGEHLNSQGPCGLPRDETPNAVDGTLNAPFVLALMAVVDRSITQWFKDNPTFAHLEKEMRGPRPNCQNSKFVFVNVRPVDPEIARPRTAVVAHYRARPLDGVWATAPYLHNGSVPTLHDLLIPQDNRPPKFCVGSRQFDPKKVGLATKERESCGAWTLFDTGKLGNSNLGHSFEGKEFEAKKRPNGVIGRELTDRERDALVEYLKTL